MLYEDLEALIPGISEKMEAFVPPDRKCLSKKVLGNLIYIFLLLYKFETCLGMYISQL